MQWSVSLTKQIFWFGLIFPNLTFFELHCLSPNDINFKDFFKMEANMILKLEDYSIREQKRLDQLKKQLQEWKKWQNSYTNKKSEYVTVPQNLFHLFKKLTVDLNEIKNIMKEISYENAVALEELKPPTEYHFKQTALSLVDLQYQYDLKSEDITNGTLIDLQLNIPLPAEACYFIGQTCLELNNHRCVVDWLKTCSLSSFDKKNSQKITKLLYSSYMFLNDAEKSHYYAMACLSYDNFDNPTKDAVLDLETKLINSSARSKVAFQTNRMCRGDYSKPANANLKCRYNHENSAFLKIAPLKEEVLSEAPKILFYRDVIYDSEIELVKNLAAEKLDIGLIINQNVPQFAYRQGETAFLYERSPSLDRLDELTEDIAGQRANLSEPWQVVNYSPGGFYSVHSDYLAEYAPLNDSYIVVENRLTTMLFYLNNVTLGGETVFPRINVSVTPTKGAVVFWSNIHANGSRNFFTDHSACPVLIGEKWGFTKWIWLMQNRQCLRSHYENDILHEKILHYLI